MTAEEFRNWRKANGLTQTQAAMVVCVSTRMVQHYEAGTVKIREGVARLCATHNKSGAKK